MRVGVADRELFFSVGDEGPGIPEAERAKIFDMFYTAARGDRGGQGTGLGLAIIARVAAAQGIAVDYAMAGDRALVTLRLPPAEEGSAVEAE